MRSWPKIPKISLQKLFRLSLTHQLTLIKHYSNHIRAVKQQLRSSTDETIKSAPAHQISPKITSQVLKMFPKSS